MTDIPGIFDVVTGNPFVGIAIGLGMVISLLLTESVGVTAGGLIAPGYIALSLHNPMAVIITFAISLITLLIVHLLSMKIIIYGKRRLVFCILIAFIIGFLVRDIPLYMNIYNPGGDYGFVFSFLDSINTFLSKSTSDMIFIGYLIPGLIASWMDRQGVVLTVSTILLIASYINLILMVIVKYV